VETILFSIREKEPRPLVLRSFGRGLPSIHSFGRRPWAMFSWGSSWLDDFFPERRPPPKPGRKRASASAIRLAARLSSACSSVLIRFCRWVRSRQSRRSPPVDQLPARL
jgi:hypothetical protein